MFLDADCLPTLDPRPMFDIAPYTRTGALFWYDWCMIRSSRRAMWDIFHLHAPNVPDFDGQTTMDTKCDPSYPLELESGQLIVDKRRVWRGLWMTLFINMHHSYFYTLLYGDKQVAH